MAMLVVEQQLTVGGRRVLTDGSGLDSTFANLRGLSNFRGGGRVRRAGEEDSGNEINLVLERRVYDSKTGIEISREKVLEGRKSGNG